MAKLEEEFNSETAPPREEFDAIPPGPQTVMIVGSALKDTKPSQKSPNGGQMIVLEMDIQDGEYAGRKLFDRLNIKNDNPKAVSIAFGTLAEIVKAVFNGAKTKIKDTEELHNRRIVVNVKVEPAQPYTKDGVTQPGKPSNSITRYLPYTGGGMTSAASQQQTAAPAAAQPPQAAGESVPPWKRKKV